MSKYVQVGSVAVAFHDLKNLSPQEKFEIIRHMFDSVEKDTLGQIVVYTEMMHDASGNVVAFESVDTDTDEPDPYEDEEEEEELEVHSSEIEEELPDTLRTPASFPIAS